MRIFVVNGAPGCGKTTFEHYARTYMLEHGYICMIYSTIDFVKEIAHKCGWDGTKTPENRKFLSDLKKLLTDWDDVPFKKLEERLEDFEMTLVRYECSPADGVAFIDCREPEEIKRICETFGAKSILVLGREVDMEALNSNKSDKEVFNYDYDITIDNSGNLDDLIEEVKKFIEKDLA